MHHTAKALGLKKVSKGGKIFYEPINKDPRRGEGNQSLIKDSFADGKKPGRKGLSKRVGVSQNMSISLLKKIAKTAKTWNMKNAKMQKWKMQK